MDLFPPFQFPDYFSSDTNIKLKCALENNVWPLDPDQFDMLEIKFISDIRDQQRDFIHQLLARPDRPVITTSLTWPTQRKDPFVFIDYRTLDGVPYAEIVSARSVVTAEAECLRSWTLGNQKRPDLRKEESMIREVLFAKNRPTLTPGNDLDTFLPQYVKWLQDLWSRTLKVYYLKDDGSLARIGSDSSKEGEPKFFLDKVTSDSDGVPFVLIWIRPHGWNRFRQFIRAFLK